MYSNDNDRHLINVNDVVPLSSLQHP